MTRTNYFATTHGNDRLMILSFDPDAAGEGAVGDSTTVSIYTTTGRETETEIPEGEIVSAVSAPDRNDLWLLTRFGSLWSLASVTEIANLSKAPTDQFIGMAWLGQDLMLFGGNNLMRRVDTTDFSSVQISGLQPLPLPDGSEFQATIAWATQNRETYAVFGTSALHFVAARSHGEVAIVEEGVVSIQQIAGAETTRFADLARDTDGSLWLAGANDAPRVVRLLANGTSRVVSRGSQVDQAPTSLAAWEARMFLGDESYENGGLYDLSSNGIGRRWPGLKDVVKLVPTSDRLWIVGSSELHVLESGTLTQIPLIP